ncbi:MAG TPA: RagB/SusD family nutrient uptake outer membrane protein [Chitinophagaceae bacterium]|nr:RagB/SusD family nutrient uptake outer membrane protein [Chitinophagaceae bacterium]
MKRFNYRIFIPAGLFTLLVVYACSKSFTTIKPLAAVSPDVLANSFGIRGILIGAYSMLDGIGGAGGSEGPWSSAGSNWVYGSVCADDSHKGSDPGDQQDITPLMRWEENASNGYLADLWAARYDGVQRANDVLRTLPLAADMSDADKTEATAEARFLRGFYHLDLKKVFGNIPFIDETISYANGNWRVPNTADAWPMIEADFQFAYENLPETQSETGRANKWAAGAFLAKCYVFEHKWADALSLLHTVVSSGKNAMGQKYALLANFADNFNPAKNHLIGSGDPELVFAAVSSVNDGGGANNANAGDVLNFPYGGGPGTCCGFNQPSWSLANAFKVDGTTGLPLTYTNDNNLPDLKNDEGINSNDPYTPDSTTPVDPRIDWTMGRRGIPYLDWGIMPGQNWIRNQASAGPYVPIKNVYYSSQTGTLTDNSSWTSGYTANNILLMRFADVLLMCAEAEVEAGSLSNAQDLVNQVRNRMTPSSTWVQNSPAKYKIGLYPAGWFTAQGQAVARKAVQWERRLELAMEGHRFFDLVRYGTAQTELNAYVTHEVSSGYLIMKGASFKATSGIFAIPQHQIDLSSLNGTPTLTQNPGY